MGGYTTIAANGYLLNHGFRLRDGSFTSIDYPGAVITSASGINNTAQVVGLQSNQQFTWWSNQPGYLLTNGAFSQVAVPPLPTGLNTTEPTGINNTRPNRR